MAIAIALSFPYTAGWHNSKNQFWQILRGRAANKRPFRVAAGNESRRWLVRGEPAAKGYRVVPIPKGCGRPLPGGDAGRRCPSVPLE